MRWNILIAGNQEKESAREKTGSGVIGNGGMGRDIETDDDKAGESIRAQRGEGEFGNWTIERRRPNLKDSLQSRS